MILLAGGILVPKIQNDSAGCKFMILSWNKFIEKNGEEEEREVLAYCCHQVWKCIPVRCVPFSLNQIICWWRQEGTSTPKMAKNPKVHFLSPKALEPLSCNKR
jgi:hypothetical protein